MPTRIVYRNDPRMLACQEALEHNILYTLNKHRAEERELRRQNAKRWAELQQRLDAELAVYDASQ